MVKSFKYIIKRIIIGVGIALALMFIKGSLIANVFANEISAYQWGGDTLGVDALTSSYTYNISPMQNGVQPWHDHGNGILRFNLSINKVGGSSTESYPIPRTILATSNGQRYVCSFGSAQWQNSTFVGVTYSVECPMNLVNHGVDSIIVAFNVTQSTSNNAYQMILSSDASFEVYEDTQVNVTTDTSSTTNAINNQITNDNQNTTNIINNQNDNTQQQIESQKVCKDYDKNNIVIDNQYIDGYYGSLRDNNNFGITDYINIENSTIEVLTTRTGSAGVCFYNINKTLISCIAGNELSVGIITIPTGSSYFRASINKSENKPTFKICTNGNQAIANGQQQINDTLNDDSGVPDSDLSDLFSDFEQSDTPISDLLTMPLTLIQAYIDGMSGTCQSIVLGRLYGENLFIPCINLEEYLGSDLWSTIDILISLFMIYNLSQLLIFAFDGITSLDDNFQSLYGPRHAGPPQSRVERNSDLY